MFSVYIPHPHIGNNSPNNIPKAANTCIILESFKKSFSKDINVAAVAHETNDMCILDMSH